MHRRHLHRRHWLGQVGGALTALVGLGLSGFNRPSPAARLRSGSLPGSKAVADESHATFSMTTYGLQKLTASETIELIGNSGFDGVEVCTRPEWPTAPERLSKAARADLRGLLEKHSLVVTAAMEHLPPTADDQSLDDEALDDEAREGGERLKRVAELCRHLQPDRQPLIQTVLGGGDWETQRPRYQRWLKPWLRAASTEDFRIAIKPHRSGAMSTPTHAVQLIEQLGKPPQLGLVYDYSHYAFRDLTVAATLQAALPHLFHVVIKDAVRRGERVGFALPGATGNFDYVELFRRLAAGGYRGDVCCEVSSLIWRQTDYDPRVATRRCFQQINPIFSASPLGGEREN